jgi:ribulose 1,5-bisphosphate synthetase/thiazole synthase
MFSSLIIFLIELIGLFKMSEENTTKPDFDIIIIGAGISGLTSGNFNP